MFLCFKYVESAHAMRAASIGIAMSILILDIVIDILIVLKTISQVGVASFSLRLIFMLTHSRDLSGL